jgi:YaiO family outer membrane protein
VRRRGAALGGGLLVLAAAAATAAPAAWRAESGFTREHVGGGQPAWRQLDVALLRREGEGADAHVFALDARRAWRHGARDDEIGLAAALPLPALSPRLGLSLRATLAPGAAFLPRAGAALEARWRLDGGWVALGGLGRQRFEPADAPGSGVSLASLGAEHYRGPWRAAAGLSLARLDGGDSATGLRLALDRTFGEVTRVGLLAARGRELEATPQGVLSSRVDSVVLRLRWGFAPGWAVDTDLARHRVTRRERGGVALPGAATRDAVRLALRHDF